VDAVRGHGRGMACGGAIGEAEHGCPGLVIQPCHLVTEADTLARHGTGQRGMQVAAVCQQVRRAVPPDWTRTKGPDPWSLTTATDYNRFDADPILRATL